ncbi:MAG: tRNA (adenosine(37)-N6)-threonylcarbamoyltransferase complex ATPase subunit type 1 TsaE [Saccharofermentans sp.]|nr:tRNA (adenosine(37)-N6)-threonylcarbamoyltransferase complex ATPase subunit type 1 TsaE [Saccharofermentans sp.]
MKISFTTVSSEQTERFGEALSKYLEAGTVIALDGDLGAGKTCLARGIARGIGAEDPVASPTFTIVNEYSGGRLMLFHFDTYRLSGEDDFYASGLDEYFTRNGVCVIEWGRVIEGALPENTMKMKISGNGDERRFDVTGSGSVGAENVIRAATEAGCTIL